MRDRMEYIYYHDFLEIKNKNIIVLFLTFVLVIVLTSLVVASKCPYIVYLKFYGVVEREGVKVNVNIKELPYFLKETTLLIENEKELEYSIKRISEETLNSGQELYKEVQIGIELPEIMDYENNLLILKIIKKKTNLLNYILSFWKEE